VTGPVRLEVEGGVGTIRLDRPPMNALNGEIQHGLIAACREGKPEMANGNVHDAHYGCVLGHLMNNSYRLGEQLPFNLKAGRFGDNKDAADHFATLHEVMSDGVGIPEEGNQYTVGPTLTFDPDSEKHIGDHAAEANQLLKDPDNAGFEVPGVADV